MFFCLLIGCNANDVIVTTAMLEFYSDTSDAGKDIALKIFELGLKKCIQEPAYVLCYLDFLGHLNDDNSTLPPQHPHDDATGVLTVLLPKCRHALFV